MTDRLRLVLVELDAGVAAWWEAALGTEGWLVSLVSDGDAGFQVVRKAQPAVVMMRSRAAGGLSLPVLKRLRSSPHTALIPVVVLQDQRDEQTDTFERWGAHVLVGESVTPAAVSSAARALVRPATTYPLAPADVLEAPDRLAVLARTRLLDSTPEAVFDHVTRLAARLLDVPTVLMSLVDRDRQFFKSHVGVPAPVESLRETPLSHSFCQWVVADRDELIVSDTREHPLFRLAPATTEFGVVAYAGVPLCAGTAQTIGSFCAMDQKPRRWGVAELDVLHDAAHVVEGVTALRQVADQSAEAFRPTVQAVGRAISAATRLMTRHESRLSEAEHDALVQIVGDLGRQLAEVKTSEVVATKTVS